MSDEGMSEDAAEALAVEVRRVTGHDVAVRVEDAFFVVEVRRTAQGDSFTLWDEQDWKWLGPRIRETE